MIFKLLIRQIFLSFIYGLTADERNELFRKFKYYYPTVRPTAPLNRLANINGSFFALNGDLQVRSSLVSEDHLYLDFHLIINYNDDRLIFRELTYRFQLPPEYRPWTPNIATIPHYPLQTTVILDPRNGDIIALHKFNSKIPCSAEIWQYPFHLFQCDVRISTEGDERIFLQSISDLRSNNQKHRFPLEIDKWPEVVLRFSYPHGRFSSIFKIILPSALFFLMVVLAQLKMFKVQLPITLTSLLGITIMQSTRSITATMTLEDLWLFGTYIHIISVLAVNLLFVNVLPKKHRSKSATFEKNNPGSILKRVVINEPNRPLKLLTEHHEKWRSEANDNAHHQFSQTIHKSLNMEQRKLSIVVICFCYISFACTYFSFVLLVVLK